MGKNMKGSEERNRNSRRECNSFCHMTSYSQNIVAWANSHSCSNGVVDGHCGHQSRFT